MDQIFLWVLSRRVKSMLNSTVISNIDFACRTSAVPLLSSIYTLDSMGTFHLAHLQFFLSICSKDQRIELI